MEYKNISSNFTLQTQIKHKNTKIQTFLHEIFLFSKDITLGFLDVLERKITRFSQN